MTNSHLHRQWMPKTNVQIATRPTRLWIQSRPVCLEYNGTLGCNIQPCQFAQTDCVLVVILKKSTSNRHLQQAFAPMILRICFHSTSFYNMYICMTMMTLYILCQHPSNSFKAESRTSKGNYPSPL